MKITFSKISEKFLDFLRNPDKEFNYGDELYRLIYSSIKMSKALWYLEDSARLSELSDQHG